MSAEEQRKEIGSKMYDAGQFCFMTNQCWTFFLIYLKFIFLFIFIYLFFILILIFFLCQIDVGLFISP